MYGTFQDLAYINLNINNLKFSPDIFTHLEFSLIKVK